MLASFLLFITCFSDLNYAQIFGKDYQEALFFCTANRSMFEQKATQYDLETKELMAIVFPELIRHSAWSDFLETKALTYLYVNQGKDVADFSIGSFQMKPSFVEKLERTIKENKELKTTFQFILFDAKTTEKAERTIRLERLQKKDWQLDYLCCFYKIIDNEFQKELATLSLKERIYFFAAAYNAGFDQSFDSIQKWTQKACYPYGIKYPSDQQYIYADVAWDYYKQQ